MTGSVRSEDPCKVLAGLTGGAVEFCVMDCADLIGL